MLTQLGEWVRALLVVAVLGNLAQWLLPEGTFRRYAGLVVGLVLLAAMVGPFQRWLQGMTALPALSWNNPAAADHYRRLVRGEEERAIAAMVGDYPGVRRVSVRVGAHQVTVTVETERPLAAGFHQYVAGAVAAGGPGGRPVRILVRPAGETR